MITNIPAKYQHLFADSNKYPNTKLIGILKNDDDSEMCFICEKIDGNAHAYIFHNKKFYSHIYAAWCLTVDQIRRWEEKNDGYTIWETA